MSSANNIIPEMCFAVVGKSFMHFTYNKFSLNSLWNKKCFPQNLQRLYVLFFAVEYMALLFISVREIVECQSLM